MHLQPGAKSSSLKFIKSAPQKKTLNTLFASNFLLVSLGRCARAGQESAAERRQVWPEWQQVLCTGSGAELPLSFFFLDYPLNETAQMQQKVVGFFFLHVFFWFFPPELTLGWWIMEISVEKKKSLTWAGHLILTILGQCAVQWLYV